MAKPQLALDLSDRGRHEGRRAGAGRKPNRAKGLRSRVPHRTRDRLTRHTPLHITLRLVESVGWVRRRDCYSAVRRAMVTVLPRLDAFRICRVSLQSNHVHLIVEANDRATLTAFLVSAARRLNAALGRAGPRWATLGRAGPRWAALGRAGPRWAAAATCSPIATTWSRGATRRRRATPWRLYGFREHQAPLPWPDEPPLPIAFPQSHLLATKWRELGLLSVWQTPGAAACSRARPCLVGVGVGARVHRG